MGPELRELLPKTLLDRPELPNTLEPRSEFPRPRLLEFTLACAVSTVAKSLAVKPCCSN